MTYRLFKATYTKDGKTKESAKWYVEFRDQLQTVRRIAGFTSKSATDELGRNLVKLVEYHGATGGQVDPALSLGGGLSQPALDFLTKIPLSNPFTSRATAKKLKKPKSSVAGVLTVDDVPAEWRDFLRERTAI